MDISQLLKAVAKLEGGADLKGQLETAINSAVESAKTEGSAGLDELNQKLNQLKTDLEAERGKSSTAQTTLTEKEKEFETRIAEIEKAREAETAKAKQLEAEKVQGGNRSKLIESLKGGFGDKAEEKVFALLGKGELGFADDNGLTLGELSGVDAIAEHIKTTYKDEMIGVDGTGTGETGGGDSGASPQFDKLEALMLSDD